MGAALVASRSKTSVLLMCLYINWEDPDHILGVVQMYNEEVNDLLEPANRKLAIKEDPEEGVKVLL